MLIDSDEAIKRMQNVIEHYKKYGYMEEAMYRLAVGHCIAVIKEMEGNNNDIFKGARKQRNLQTIGACLE